MKDKWGKKNKTDLFNERIKQRKEKEQERARLFEEAGKPDPNFRKDDSAQQPPTPSTPAPSTPAKPEPRVAPAPKPKDGANRPGRAERERRGHTRNGRKF